GALLRTGVPLSRNGVHRRGPRQAMRDDGGLQGDDRGVGRRRLADARCDGEAAYGQHLTWVFISLPCGRSRIGTGARLRTVWRKPWGFESLRPHNPTAPWRRVPAYPSTRAIPTQINTVIARAPTTPIRFGCRLNQLPPVGNSRLN